MFFFHPIDAVPETYGSPRYFQNKLHPKIATKFERLKAELNKHSFVTLEEEKSLPKENDSESKEYVIVPCHTKASNEYFSRLQLVLEDHEGKPLITKNTTGTLALLPRFWLNQLPSKAIDELSREFSCPKSLFR